MSYKGIRHTKSTHDRWRVEDKIFALLQAHKEGIDPHTLIYTELRNEDDSLCRKAIWNMADSRAIILADDLTILMGNREVYDKIRDEVASAPMS